MTASVRAVRAAVIAAALALHGCGARSEAPRAAVAPPTRSTIGAVAAPEDDVLFRHDPRWVGADAAYSVDLGEGRSLWLFQDTLISTTGDGSRRAVRMVRSSVAVQTGRDPATAPMRFAWGTAADGAPSSYFADDAPRWTWPMHAIRVGSGPLVVFVSVMEKVAGKPNFDFAPALGRVGIVGRPDGDPARWSWRFVDVPARPFDAVLGGAVVADGDELVVLATRFTGTHAGYLARLRTRELLAGRVAPRWWTGARWTPEDELRGAPAVVIDDASPECSIHFDAARRRWIHVASRGFGATPIAVRFADRITGPWSAAVDVFRPDVSRAPGAFVYAGKAHPELTAPGGGLLVTYATNHEDLWTLFKPEGQDLYWPRFVRVELP